MQGKDRDNLECLSEVCSQTIRQPCEPSSGLPHQSKGRNLKGPTHLAPCHLSDLSFHSSCLQLFAIHSSNPSGCKHLVLPSHRSNPLVEPAGLTLPLPSGLCANAPFLVRLSSNTLLKTAALFLLHPALSLP